MIVGFGRNDTKQSSRPTSFAESRAYSAPPVLQQYSVAPACFNARTRSTTAEIGMRLGPAERTSVSSTSTNTISDAGLTMFGKVHQASTPDALLTNHPTPGAFPGA